MFQEDTLERSEIMAEIAVAFYGVRLGRGISLHQARHLDDQWHDNPALRELDREVLWNELTDEKMRQFSDVFAFLDAEGFRFYLPAFIGWVLRDAADGLDWSFCCALCGLRGRDGLTGSPHVFRELIDLLTPDQTQAICHFIEYETRSDWSREALPAWTHFWSKEFDRLQKR